MSWFSEQSTARLAYCTGRLVVGRKECLDRYFRQRYVTSVAVPKTVVLRKADLIYVRDQRLLVWIRRAAVAYQL